MEVEILLQLQLEQLHTVKSIQEEVVAVVLPVILAGQGYMNGVAMAAPALS